MTLQTARRIRRVMTGAGLAAALATGGWTGTCSATLASALVNGSVRWQVKAWSTALGHGPWSADGWFTVSALSPSLFLQ